MVRQFTNKHKENLSRALKGRRAPNKGIKHSDETKIKMRKTHPSIQGKNHPNWKGGQKIATARKHSKRRELFGFIPINKIFKNSEGHHIDLNYVLFIPKELHKSVWHSNIKDINMDEINNLAEEWYLKDQGVIL